VLRSRARDLSPPSAQKAAPKLARASKKAPPDRSRLITSPVPPSLGKKMDGSVGRKRRHHPGKASIRHHRLHQDIDARETADAEALSPAVSNLKKTQRWREATGPKCCNAGHRQQLVLRNASTFLVCGRRAVVALLSLRGGEGWQPLNDCMCLCNSSH
jgi:hypothetical protein